MSPRILTLDLETSPNVAHVWGLWNVNVALPQLLESGRVIGVAAKWHGAKSVMWRSEFHHSREQMLADAHQWMSDADVIVTFNGINFDIPWLNAEFAREGLLPPAPSKQVDLLRAVKNQFRFPSNKLAYVTKALGLSGKLSHTGHEMWVKCLEGDDKAWALMRRYAMQDVRTTEELFDRVRPWIPGMNLGVFADDDRVCPACMGTDLQRRGVTTKIKGVYPRYSCNTCGRWSTGGKAIKMAELA